MKAISITICTLLILPTLCMANHKDGKGFGFYYGWDMDFSTDELQLGGLFINLLLFYPLYLDTRAEYTWTEPVDFFSVAAGLKLKVWSPYSFSVGSHGDIGLKWIEDGQLGWTAGIDLFLNPYGAMVPINIIGSIDFGNLHSSSSDPTWIIRTGIFFSSDIFSLFAAEPDTILWFE